MAAASPLFTVALAPTRRSHSISAPAWSASVARAAKRFHESPEYQEAKRLRHGTPSLNMVATQGLA